MFALAAVNLLEKVSVLSDGFMRSAGVSIEDPCFRQSANFQGRYPQAYLGRSKRCSTRANAQLVQCLICSSAQAIGASGVKKRVMFYHGWESIPLSPLSVTASVGEQLPRYIHMGTSPLGVNGAYPFVGRYLSRMTSYGGR